MKKIFIIFLALCCINSLYAQKKTIQPPVPCDGSVDAMPGIYTDHTNPKYGFSLRGTAQEKTAMMNQLIAIEKIEEASRKDFKLTGCVARVSFSNNDKYTYANSAYTKYGYQLGVYRNVCNINEHVVKTVDEYLTVFRVDVNPFPAQNFLTPAGTGEFFLTGTVRYDISIDAKEGPNYTIDRVKNPSRISRYLSEAYILTSRSDNYKDYHGDFLKFITGEGYVENWQGGDRYGKSKYKFIDRHYLIVKPGVPVLIPITRKQYLEDLLEYYEIEKANFYFGLDNKIKNLGSNTSESAKKMRATLEADKLAYPQHYEAKKAKVKELLSTQKAEWLQKPAVIDLNRGKYDANQRLADIGKFFDGGEDEKHSALYIYNPEYFKIGANQSTKPLCIEVQFRYELTDDYGFSSRLFTNFLKNYDFNELKKMVR